MFWFLHYAVKAGIGLALLGCGALLYANRAVFSPAQEWVETLRRAETETLPIVGEAEGRVIRVPAGDAVIVRDGQGAKVSFRIAGVLGPPPSRHPRSERAVVFRRSQEFLRSLALSNDVRVAYTFMVPEGGGLGGVYLAGTNLAIPLLREGMVIVHDPSLKSLPIQDQVRLLAAEKEAREARRGVWAGELVRVTPEGADSSDRRPPLAERTKTR
jgi:endonuclease YncB( thermonuclease family)